MLQNCTENWNAVLQKAECKVPRGQQLPSVPQTQASSPAGIQGFRESHPLSLPHGFKMHWEDIFLDVDVHMPVLLSVVHSYDTWEFWLTYQRALYQRKKERKTQKNPSTLKAESVLGRELFQDLFSCHTKMLFLSVISLHREGQMSLFPHLPELWRSLNTLICTSRGGRLGTLFIAEET